MYLKVKELKQIENLLYMIDYDNLSEEDKKEYMSTYVMIVNLYRRKKENNKKAWDFIKDKRKNNPDYAR